MWESPKALAIIIAAVAGIAGVLGFQLGRREPAAQVIQLPPGTTITIPSRP
jgi:Flp pilus assembly protein CpaB